MKKLIILLFIPLISFTQINEQSKLNLENEKEKIINVEIKDSGKKRIRMLIKINSLVKSNSDSL